MGKNNSLRMRVFRVLATCLAMVSHSQGIAIIPPKIPVPPGPNVSAPLTFSPPAGSPAAPVISDSMFTDLGFMSQYAAAGYCNYNTAVGSPVKCANNACPQVESNGAKVIGTFVGINSYIGVTVMSDPVRKFIVVSYVGASSPGQWIATYDISYSHADDFAKGAKVRSSYLMQHYDAKEAVRSAIFNELLSHGDYRIVITGHSIGGAVATVAAAWFSAPAQNLTVDLWTFGSPRVGNNDFANFISQKIRIWHVTQGSDPIPRSPPLWSTYRSVSPEYWVRTESPKSAADVSICWGTTNSGCNGGTFGFNSTQHLMYFGNIMACGQI